MDILKIVTKLLSQKMLKRAITNKLKVWKAIFHKKYRQIFEIPQHLVKQEI